METYWIFHLAASWRGPPSPEPTPNPPLAADSILPTETCTRADTARTAPHVSQRVEGTARSSMRAASVQMVFASRMSQDFITPEHVSTIEAWCGQAVLEAVRGMDILPDVRARRSDLPYTQLTSWTDVALAPRGRERLGHQGCSVEGSTVGPGVPQSIIDDLEMTTRAFTSI